MELPEFVQKCICCVCAGRLCEDLMVAPVLITVDWNYPSWGNMEGYRFGISFLCIECANVYLSNKQYGVIKWVIEVRREDVIYHEIDWDKRIVIKEL